MANGPPVAISEESSVSVPNMVFELERYVFRLTESTAPKKLPLSWLRNPGIAVGVVRPVTEAVMVRLPAANELRFSDPRSTDRGLVETLLTSTLVENVPKLLLMINGSSGAITV